MSLFQLAIIFFIVTNPIGNSPTILSLIKDHSLPSQQRILFRESMFSLIIAIFFLFLGEIFLRELDIRNYALTISGGILLFTVALSMIFSDKSESKMQEPKKDPFIVPIATPLLSGAGLLTMIMLYSKQEENDLKILFALLVAWIGITAVLVLMPYAQVFIGKRGLAALEQLMGMLLAMLSVEMIVQGSSLFLTLLVASSNLG